MGVVMSRYINRIYLAAVLAVFLITSFVIAGNADDQEASIRGILYVSYPGDLSFDVMFGADVEILLISGDGTVEKEFETLKQKLVPPIRAQENAVTKAMVDVRSPTSSNKLKEKQEVLKRERLTLEKLRLNYESEVIGLLAKKSVQKTRTDKKGNFRFEALSPGRYLLHARYELRGTEANYFWLYPVESKPGEQAEVSLDKAKTIHIYQLGGSEKEGGQ